MGIQDPQNKQNTTYYFGDTMMVKSKFTPIAQKAIENDEELDKHTTLMPHRHGREGHQPEQIQPNVGSPLDNAILEKGYEEEGMHRHQGHPETHPVRLRHRKTSADPLHKEEDGLVDQWKDLYDKAQQGMCTPQELQQLEQIRARVGELNASRATDAERILGLSMAMNSIRKAQDLVGQPVHVVDSSPKKFEVKLEQKDESWRNKASEYGDPEPKDIIPNNDGYKDQEDHSESVWGTVPKDNRVNVVYPTNVKDAPVTKSLQKATIKKAIEVTQNVQKMLLNDWGISPDGDTRFSDPFLLQNSLRQES